MNMFLSILSNNYICQMTLSGGILRGVSVSECKMIEADYIRKIKLLTFKYMQQQTAWYLEKV